MGLRVQRGQGLLALGAGRGLGGPLGGSLPAGNLLHPVAADFVQGPPDPALLPLHHLRRQHAVRVQPETGGRQPFRVRFGELVQPEDGVLPGQIHQIRVQDNGERRSRALHLRRSLDGFLLLLLFRRGGMQQRPQFAPE